MKRLLLILAAVLTLATNSQAEGYVFPTDDVTLKHYSMGAYVEPNGEELNWDGGYYITFAYSNTTNDVWVSNLFPQFFVDGTSEKDGYTRDMMTWVHGTVQGDRITFPVEKIFHYTNPDNGNECDLYVQAIDAQNDVEYVRNSFDFIIKDNGDIQIDDDTDNPSLYVCLLQHDADGNPIVGSNGVSVEDYALGYEFILLTDEQQHYPALPEGIEMKPWKYSYTSWDSTTGTRDIQIGQQGNDIYVAGLSTQMSYWTDEPAYPDVLFRGTLSADGNSFTLPSNQFYGIENYFGVYYINFLTAWQYWDEDEMYHPLAGVTFNRVSATQWELAEDYNIGCSCLDGLLFELIARATLKYAGTDDIQSLKAMDEVTPIYNIHGQRITQPTKGVNIIKGRKVLVNR